MNNMFGVGVNPLLLLDFYKTTHAEQYPKGLTKMVSYFTPRMSRLEGEDKLVVFGVQAFIKTYLVDAFDKYFFKRNKEEVLEEYKRLLDYTIGNKAYSLKKVEELYELGYLPLEIKAIDEGTRVPMKVPMVEISNTHPDFVWLVNTIETNMSCYLWHCMVSANVGYNYRQIVNKYYDETVDKGIPRSRALGDFSMRGQESAESAIKSSAAFCLSFENTATVPAIMFLEKNYNCDCTKENVAFGAISTEHSVMCSNFAIDGDEITQIKRLLTEIYPESSFSMVSDSYDYWRLVTELLPQCKKEIMEHKGMLLVRGDSGDPVDIICGEPVRIKVDTEKEFELLLQRRDLIIVGEYIKVGDKYRQLQKDENNNDVWLTFDEAPAEVKGTVECLWDEFGGSINSKGYKVINQHIKAIYGDSITPQRAIQIYKRLKQKGFAANNVSLGVGSFSMQCSQVKGVLAPYTRDTYGIAVKATYAEKDGKGIEIFKNPKTDKDNFKKSQKGLCWVYTNDEGEITYKDSDAYYEVDQNKYPNLLKQVFKDGKLTHEQSLSEIREKLHEGNF